MTATNSSRSSAIDSLVRAPRIIWALLMRELATRYGRDNIGFLWIIGEPLIFAGGVMIMWSLIRPPYEYGIAIIPFVVTGYLPLLLLRHPISHGLNCISANQALLYHRRITLLHLFVSRTLLEVLGVTFALVFVVAFMHMLGLMELPPSLSLVYEGWLLLAWQSFGLVLIFGSLVGIAEYFEKVAGLLTYVMIPMTGTFYMVAWLPPQFRSLVLKIPFVNCVEMIRGGFFGEFYPTYHSGAYAAYWGAGLTLLGLLLLRFVRGRMEVE